MTKTKIVWMSILLTLVLIATSVFNQSGSLYFTSDYFETRAFHEKMQQYESELKMALVDTYSVEEWSEWMTIEEWQKEEYLNRYGTMQEQLQSVQSRYAALIDQAKESEDSERVEKLTQEKEDVMNDLTLNFTDDAYLEKKMKKEAATQIVEEIEKQKQRAHQYLNQQGVYYDFESTVDGEKQTNVLDSEQLDSIYQKTYDTTRPMHISLVEEVNVESFDGDSATVHSYSKPNQTQQYIGDVWLTSKAIHAEQKSFKQAQMMYFIMILSGIVALILLLIEVRKIEWSIYETPQWMQEWKRLFIDVRLFIVLLLAMFFKNQMENSGFILNYHEVSMLRQLFNIGTSVLFNALLVLILFLALFSFYEEWREKRLIYKNTFIFRLIEAVRAAFGDRTMGTQLFILLVGFFLAGIGFAVVLMAPHTIVFYAICVVFFGLPVLYLYFKRFGYLNRVFQVTEKMAEGQEVEVPVIGKSPIAKHAQQLNRLSHGIQYAVTQQHKSERMKTELITNVSHDLRTPLTSIITYTDLLKTQQLSEEERQKYIRIIEQKSERLKILIEDLFEVSKMASGNMQLNRATLDLTQLLQQVLAERQIELDESPFDVRVQLPAHPIHATVDGERWWRVIDNLVSNALKYSLEGTRIYIDLEQQQQNAVFTVRNISKYELAGNLSELTDRFKRADESRNTEGSGLGLAIVDSIITLHGGELVIEMDGDLFKVTVKLPIDR